MERRALLSTECDRAMIIESRDEMSFIHDLFANAHLPKDRFAISDKITITNLDPCIVTLLHRPFAHSTCAVFLHGHGFTRQDYRRLRRVGRVVEAKLNSL
jgi:hypothetical protein